MKTTTVRCHAMVYVKMVGMDLVTIWTKMVVRHISVDTAPILKTVLRMDLERF